MSGLVSLEVGTVRLADVVPVISPTGRRALSDQLWELAPEVGSLRRAGAPDWLCNRVAGRVDVCLNIVSGSAAELYHAGIDIHEAIQLVEERGERVRDLTGEPW